MRLIQFKNVTEGEIKPKAYMWCGFGYVNGKIDSLQWSFTSPFQHTEEYVSPSTFGLCVGRGQTVYHSMLRRARGDSRVRLYFQKCFCPL